MHIRQGDYKTYKDEEHFFPVSHYAGLARSLAEEDPSVETIVVVCSDGDVSDADFEGLTWRWGPKTLLGDLAALSRCDLVMGPFSTFNRWAAFYGDKPRYELRQGVTRIGLSDFRPQTDLTFPKPKPTQGPSMA